jgi:hypothetical protein
MPALEVRGEAWSGTYSGLLGWHTIDVSGSEIIAAALSVGAPLLHSPFSIHAVNMAIYKALGLACAVDHSGSSLVRPAQYSGLDPTEKANLSYWTGMTFAALVAERCLDVPSVWHISSMVRTGRARLQPPSHVVADLLGQDGNGDWHVIEAKARQGSASAADRTSWEAQTETIRSMDGRAPATRSYCLTRVGDPYKVEFVDPPDSEGREHVAVAVMTEAVRQGYYEPFRAWLSAPPDTTGGGHTLRIDRGVELTVRRAAFDASTQLYWFVGLRSDLLHVGSETGPPAIRNAPLALDQGHVRSDGIAVIGSPEPDIR